MEVVKDATYADADNLERSLDWLDQHMPLVNYYGEVLARKE